MLPKFNLISTSMLKTHSIAGMRLILNYFESTFNYLITTDIAVFIFSLF